MIQTDTREWLSLRQAADLLGVHPATVRSWADAGRVPHIRTPGGHRRFSRVELEAFLVKQRETPQPNKLKTLAQSAIGRARQQMSRSEVTSQAWHAISDQAYRQQKRLSGQRMLALVIQHVGRQTENGVALDQGRNLSREYGKDAAQRGLTLADAVRAFLFFRDALVEVAFQQEILEQKVAEEGLTLYRRMNHFFNESLVAMVEAYEETRSASPTISV